jgi:ABC-type uncharacterized transport system ATPase component
MLYGKEVSRKGTPNDMNIFDYNRIIIVGNNGSGKSYFAEKLSAMDKGE